MEGYSNFNKNFWENTKKFQDIISKDMEKANLFETFHNLERMDHTLLDCMVSYAIASKYVTSDYKKYDKLNSFANNSKNMAIKMSKNFAKALPGLVMTNLGKVKIKDKYGKLKIDKMYFLPSTGEEFPLALGAITINGKLVVTVNYVDENRQSMLQIVTDKASEIIKESCK